MQLPPASVLAAWPKPNYIDPVTRGNENVVLNIVLFTLLVIFMSIRIVTRTTLKRVFGTDDVLIILALIPTTIFFVLSVLADTKYLWIRHQYDIPADHVVTGLKMVMGAMLSFAVASTLTKLSMLMFSRRLLANSSIFWPRITVLAMYVVGIQGFVFCLTTIFQCRPPQDYWKISVDPQPNCINQTASLLAAGLINTVTDFMVVLLPIRMVVSLQLPRREIFIVVVLFAFGFLSCLAGIARTYYLYLTTTQYDQVWAAYPVWLTSALELYIGVICASIPATKPFFSTYLPKAFGSMTHSLSTLPRGSQNPTSRSTQPDNGNGEDLLELISALEKGYRSPGSTTLSSCSRAESSIASAQRGHT